MPKWNLCAHLRRQTREKKKKKRKRRARSIRNGWRRHAAALTDVIVLSGTCIFHFSCRRFMRPQSRSCNHITRQNEFEELAACVCLPRRLNSGSASSLPAELNHSVRQWREWKPPSIKCDNKLRDKAKLGRGGGGKIAVRVSFNKTY